MMNIARYPQCSPAPAHVLRSAAKPAASFEPTPQFAGFRDFGGSNGFNVLHKGIFGLVFAVMGLGILSQFVPGLSGIATERPTVQNTVGTVSPRAGLAVTVTQNREVFNSFGAKVGSFDEEGKAFDGWGKIVGYGTDAGFVYKLSSSGREKLIGEIDANGQFKGQYMQNGVDFNLPGLTRAQRAAVAALAVSSN
jgi:hypothetical protein